MAIQFQLPEIGNAEDLLVRLSAGRRGDSRPVVFLVGSALSVPRALGEPGVPGVAGVLELIREAFAELPKSLERLAELPAGAAGYAQAFGLVQRQLGPEHANEIVRRAVLMARSTAGGAGSRIFGRGRGALSGSRG